MASSDERRTALTVLSAPAEDDDSLCRRFLAGEESALARLMARHQETVYRLVRRFCACPEDGRDLTQRVFLRALLAARRALPRHSAGHFPFRPWLLRIALNLAKNHARDERRWKKAPLSLVEDAFQVPPTAPAALEQAERARALSQKVAGLPRRQREVLSLRVDAGLSFAEIASTLGIGEGAAKTSFHYAVQRLKQQLGPTEDR